MAEKYILKYQELPGFLSKTQILEHYKLYEGYYNTCEELPEKINEICKTDPTKIRGMQKTLQYALSGRNLHEIYFDTMKNGGGDLQKMSEEFKKLLEKSFGSVENFVIGLKESAKAARGWYRLELDEKNQALYHNVGDFHDEGTTANFKTIIALDVYDHAYFYDYQTKKADYIAKWLEFVDWEKISQNLK